MSKRLTPDQWRIFQQLSNQGAKQQAKLYRLTCNFTLEDWRKLRGPAYFARLDRIPVRESLRRVEFELAAVEEYLNQKSQ